MFKAAVTITFYIRIY